MIKVVLYGPESTGKTYLAQNLAFHYQCLWVPEFARHYLELKRKEYNPTTKGSEEICAVEDIPNIILGQLAFEDAFEMQSKSLLLCDTNPLQTIVYSKHYFNKVESWMEEVLTKRNYNLYLLTNNDIAWQSDPLRDRESNRYEMFELFQKELESRKINYNIISGTDNERLELSIKIIDDYLKLFQSDSRLS